jgi:hypothetical protein
MVWWSCEHCGVDVELPADDTAGFLLGCPDCPGTLVELWHWEAADHGTAGGGPARRGSVAA